MAAHDAVSLPVYSPTGDAALLRVQIEDLPEFLPRLESELKRVFRIDLMRGDEVIAEIRARESITGSEQPPLPDFMARLHKIYGNEPLKVDTTAWVRQDRDGDEYVP